MSMTESFIKDFQELSEEKQREVIDFVEYLKNKENLKIEKAIDEVLNQNAEAFKELAK